MNIDEEIGDAVGEARRGLPTRRPEPVAPTPSGVVGKARRGLPPGDRSPSGESPLRVFGWPRTLWRFLLLSGALLTAAVLTGCVSADGSQLVLPNAVAGGSPDATGTNSAIQIMALLTSLSFIPAVLMMASSFTRIIIVLSFIRNALGIPQTPPNPVLVGLALFASLFVMAPIWQSVNSSALQPYLSQQISQEEAMRRGSEPLRNFMLKQTREKDLALFVYMAKIERPRNPADIPTHVLIPAFVISELKTAFQMGFVILIPFLVIDMVVSSTLMSMGMMMLPPAVISLPFKILLFVLVDGWHLIMRSLVGSFV